MSEDYFEEEEFESQFNGKTLQRIGLLLKPHWKWVVGFLIAIACVSSVESFFTYVNKQIVDEAIIPGNAHRLIELILLYMALICVQSIGVFIFIGLTGVLGQRVEYDLRKHLFNHLQNLSLSYYNVTPVGWIMSRVTSDSGRIADLITWGLLDITWAIMNITTAIIFMMIINWQLTILVVITLPVLLAVAVWFKKRILVEYRLSRKFNSKITGAFNENITGVRIVNSLNRQAKNLDEFNELTEGMYKSSYRAAWFSALFLPSVQLISSFAVGFVVIFGGLQVDNGFMTIGGIQAFISYITFMMWPVQDMARVYASMQHAIASAERTFSLVDTPPAIIDLEGAVPATSLRGDIVFDHVDFSYESNKMILSDFNLTIKDGETIAFVGATGGGKSTIINLICRFFEPVSGKILIDGVDYRELTLASIQSRIGIVLQTPHLFSGTIRDNIRYGRLNASDADVEKIAKIAGADEFISKLENGYDEQVGESGILLSVGQKQLISLARAILADPDIFIMDEATSSVDTLTEDLIQKGMDRILHGRTSFVIAHRLSTIKRANRICVIEDGKIIEMGSHKELLKQGGHYYTLYTKQFKKEAEGKQEYFAEIKI